MLVAFGFCDWVYVDVPLKVLYEASYEGIFTGDGFDDRWYLPPA
jgi:hypothetical protein